MIDAEEETLKVLAHDMTEAIQALARVLARVRCYKDLGRDPKDNPLYTKGIEMAATAIHSAIVESRMQTALLIVADKAMSALFSDLLRMEKEPKQ